MGTAGVLPALDYIQWPKDKRPLVPFVVFIDRQGVIRAQYTGVDEAFFDSQQEQHMRDEVEKLLNEGGGQAQIVRPAGMPIDSIVAHRGASAEAPENTLEAFARAIEVGADMIEFDVRRARDGRLVISHDPVRGRAAGLPDARRNSAPDARAGFNWMWN